MAIEISTPADYSSLRRPCIFKVKRDDNTTASIIVNGRKKQMSGKLLDVNVAQYFANAIKATPQTILPTSEFVSGEATGRVISVYISVDGVASDHVLLVNGYKSLRPNKIISDVKHRTIELGEVDEVSVYLQSPASLVWPGSRVELPKGVSVVPFEINGQTPKHFTMELLDTQGALLDSVDYTICDEAGTRLCWVNEYGAIDYWNFPISYKQSTKVEQTKIYTSSGYTTTSRRAKDTTIVLSEPMSKSKLSALSQLLTTDSAWEVVDGVYTPIYITSDTVQIYDQEKMSHIEVEYTTKIDRI